MWWVTAVSRIRQPENTIESSQLAVEKGADIVELDIYVTKDKELVVSTTAHWTAPPTAPAMTRT